MKLKEPKNPKTALAYCYAISDKLKHKKLGKFTDLKEKVDDDLNTIKTRGADTPLTARQRRRIAKHVRAAEELGIFSESELQRLDARYRKALSRYRQRIESGKLPGKNAHKKGRLLEIIESSITLLSQQTIPKNRISLILDALDEIGFAHNTLRYPKLESEIYTTSENSYPTTLAEAYIWRMGEWDNFKRFENMYKKEKNRNTRRIVHFSFAMHLKNKELPIFDQDALRAVLVAYPGLTKKEFEAIKYYLVNPSGKWKPLGSAKEADLCYSTYCRVFEELASRLKISKHEIDIFLVTLGMAIKTTFQCYRELTFTLNDQQ